MLVSIGMLIACYCIARLAISTVTQPPGQTRTAALTVSVIAALGCAGVIYCAKTILDQGGDDGRPKVEVR